MTFKKLVYEQLGQAGESVYGFMREDEVEEKIYARYATTPEELFYDMGAELNEVVTIYPAGFAETDTVNVVETEMVGGTERREIQFNKGWWTDEWVVGMGSTQGLINPWQSYSDFDPRLTCFYEGNDLAWDNPMDETNCGLYLNIAETPEHSMAIWPNPVRNEMLIQRETRHDCKLEILSLTGDAVIQKQLTGFVNQVDVSNLAEGIYFVRINENNNVVVTKKVVIVK